MRTVKRAMVMLVGVVLGLSGGGCYLPLGPSSRLFIQNGTLVIGWDQFTDIASILP